jgi:hypothetical protein
MGRGYTESRETPDNQRERRATTRGLKARGDPVCAGHRNSRQSMSNDGNNGFEVAGLLVRVQSEELYQRKRCT